MLQIDNRPKWLTLKHFRQQLLKFMVEDCDYIAEEPDEQLKKSTCSYKDICMHLARAQKPGDAIHMLVSATSLMLNIPILMVYPVQSLDKHSGRISYKYTEMPPCPAMACMPWSKYPIKLMFNRIDHYFPFIDDKIGLIANLGNPAIAQLHQLCQDFNMVMEEVPDNNTLKAGLNEVTQYLKVAEKVAEKLNFANGTSLFTNEPTMEPLDVPDTSPVKTIKLRKQRKSLSDNEEEEAEGEKEGDGNQGSEGVEKGEKGSKPVREEGEPPAKKKKVDCECRDEQCYCGKQFESVAYLNKHIQVKHKTTWMCSRSNWIKGKEGEEGHWEAYCEVCSKCYSLWSHFRRKHEGRYHHYCLIGDCRFGSDELWNINMHRHKKHDIALSDEQKCPKCKQGFGQIGKYKAHIITCEMDTRPFVCNICDETFWQRSTYTCHMRQKHKQLGGTSRQTLFLLHPLW